MINNASNAQKKRWSNPSEREKQSKRLKKSHKNNPEIRKSQAKKTTTWWADAKNKAIMRSIKVKFPWDQFPKEVYLFVLMQKRVKAGYTITTWPRTLAGFNAFIKCVGLIPKDMKRPSLGRKNHSKGYQPGNCGWQEWIENSLEPSTRPGFKKQRSIDQTKRWKEEVGYRELMQAKGKREAATKRRNSDGTFSKGEVLWQ